MLRWTFLANLVVALASLATVAVQFLPARTAGKTPAFPSDGGDQVGPPPKAVVDDKLTYEFGVLGQQNTGEKTWTIKNVGKGTLKLKKVRTSCSCTIASLKNTSDTVSVEPGGSTTIKLEWQTRDRMGKYSQSADIGTNDPALPMLTLAVQGEIVPSIVIYPYQEGTIHFGTHGNDQPIQAKMAVFSPDDPDLEITSISTSQPERITATSLPLTDDQRAAIGTKIGKGKGYTVEVEVKPGMPIGALNESVVLKTNHPQRPEVRLELSGRMVGPISAVPGSVQMTVHAGTKPPSKVVTLWVRGGEPTKFEVAEAPEELKVGIEEVDDQAQGTGKDVKSRRYRLTVTVLPETRPTIINSSIILKTDHPNATELKIPVMISIINRG